MCRMVIKRSLLVWKVLIWLCGSCLLLNDYFLVDDFIIVLGVWYISVVFELFFVIMK